MTDRYDDRERFEGGRGQDAGRERSHQGNHGEYGGRGQRSGFGYRGGEGWQDDPSGYGSGRYEGRSGTQSQNRNDYDERGRYPERGNQGRSSYRGSGGAEFYPRGEEWSTGHGVGVGLGGAENSEYAGFRDTGSYYGGQGQFAAGPGQYGGGFGQYGSRRMDERSGQYNAGQYGGSNEWDREQWNRNERQGRGGMMNQQQGTHTGRGPKGYKRSDDRIKEDVNERLTQDPQIDASEIEVQVRDGEVTLTGTVDHRSNKRRAEDIIENVSGVREVHNQLRVQSGQEQTTSSGSKPGQTQSGQKEHASTMKS